MKRLLTTLLFATMLAISYHASAAVVSINYSPAGADHQGNSPNNPNALDISNIVGVAGLTLLFKSDVDGGAEEGTEAVWYDAFFANNGKDATIKPAYSNHHPSGTTIECPECFLLVKDGNNDPIWYIFDISDWNGWDELEMTDFWVGNGSISHVAIYGGVPEVPIPAAAWLFGSGLLGLVGVARRKKA